MYSVSHLGMLLKCRLGKSRSEVGPETLHANVLPAGAGASGPHTMRSKGLEKRYLSGFQSFSIIH